MQQKVLIINNSSWVSGAEVSLLSFLNALPVQSQITIVLPSTGDLSAALMAANYKVKYFQLKRFSKLGSIVGKLQWVVNLVMVSLEIARYIKRDRFTLIYANTTQSLPYAFIASLFARKKIVWHVRDCVNNKLLIRILSKKVSRAICISSFIYHQAPVKETTKCLIYNGIDLNTWTPNRKTGTLHKQLKLHADTLLIATVGQLIPWKNQLDVLRVAEKVTPVFPNVHFIIIGDDLFGTNQTYVQQLKTYAKEKGIAGAVSFAGYRSDIQYCLNEIDILLHCALNEPFGRVIIEAMALEKPVVAYNSGGVPELVTHEVTGFLASERQYPQLAEYILTLLQNDSLRRSVGVQAAKDVNSRFSIQTTVEKMKTVLQL